MAAGLLWHAGTSSAATMACAVGAAESSPVAVGASRTTRDARTGAVIDVKKDLTGRVIVELRDQNVSVRREFIRGISTTVLRTGGQQLSIQLTANDIIVSERGKAAIRGQLAVKNSLERPFKALRESAIVKAARAALDRTALDVDTFEGNTLFLTRAMLTSAAGDDTVTKQYQSWAAARIKPARVVRVQAKEGPGACWDLYAAEAIRISNDYIDCANSCGWTGWFCMGACGFLYDIRAEAAFMWFFDCSGGFFVAG